MVTKLKLRTTDDALIASLGNHGFSLALIASKVFGASSVNDDSAKRKVARVLHEHDIQLRNYRNGRNPTAKAVLGIIRRGSDVEQLIAKLTSKTTKKFKKKLAI